MELVNIAFKAVNWQDIAVVEHTGESGVALWRTRELGCVRVRMVEYSAGYKADHWCSRGHILLVMEGELITELEDGRIFTLLPGMSYEVQHDGEKHRSKTSIGAKLFIVD